MLLAVVFACGGAEPTAAPPDPPDMVVLGHSPRLDREVGVVVRGSVIDSVTTPEEALALAGETTAVVRGDEVTAGFVDAHGHPSGLAKRRLQLDLTGAPTLAETLERVRRWAATHDQGWILGRGWDQNDWSDAPEGGWPTAAALDDVTDRPTVLRRVDGHAAWLNSTALAAAGIDATTPDPEGGRILRDARGVPTGVLIDAAMGLYEVEAPPADVQQRALEEALDELAAAGLTGVHDMGVSDALLARYAALDTRGALPIRIWAYLDPDADATQRLLSEGPWGTDRLRVVGIKAYADGALGSRGALLTEAYTDEHGHHGLRITPDARIEELARRCLAVDAQLAVHAIGDAAVHETLDAFARAGAPDGGPPLRVEHAQVVRPEDRARFAELGVVASMQPTHATSDMPWAPDRLGPDRVGWAYSWQSLRQTGAILAFGSDFPVEDHRPVFGLWAATTRTAPDGTPEGGWQPAQALDLADAIAGFTEGSAAAAGAQGLGSLQPGMTADLTVWDVDTDTGPLHRTPTYTILGGDIEYARTMAIDAKSPK